MFPFQGDPPQHDPELLLAEELEVLNARRAMALADQSRIKEGILDDEDTEELGEVLRFIDKPDQRGTGGPIYDYLVPPEDDQVYELYKRYGDSLNVLMLTFINSLEDSDNNLMKLNLPAEAYESYLTFYRYFIAIEENLSHIDEQMGGSYKGLIWFKVLISNLRTFFELSGQFIPQQQLKPILSHKLLFTIAQTFTENNLAIPEEIRNQLTPDEQEEAKKSPYAGLAAALGELTFAAEQKDTVSALLKEGVPEATVGRIQAETSSQFQAAAKTSRVARIEEMGIFLQALLQGFPHQTALMDALLAKKN